jgi:hypothetical protein
VWLKQLIPECFCPGHKFCQCHSSSPAVSFQYLCLVWCVIWHISYCLSLLWLCAGTQIWGVHFCLRFTVLTLEIWLTPLNEVSRESNKTLDRHSGTPCITVRCLPQPGASIPLLHPLEAAPRWSFWNIEVGRPVKKPDTDLLLKECDFKTQKGTDKWNEAQLESKTQKGTDKWNDC